MRLDCLGGDAQVGADLVVRPALDDLSDHLQLALTEGERLTRSDPEMQSAAGGRSNGREQIPDRAVLNDESGRPEPESGLGILRVAVGGQHNNSWSRAL